MASFSYLLVTLVLAGLAVVLARLLGRRFTIGLLGALVVTLGLVYDNGVLVLGNVVGEGATLRASNWARYWIHALCTPLLIAFAAGAASRAGVKGTRAPWFLGAAWHLTAAMIVYGVVVEVPSALEPTGAGGVLRYEPAGGSSAPVPALVTNLALIVGGIALWRARGWRWLALAGIGALVGFGLAPLGAPEVTGQIAEVVLIAGIAATEGWLQGRERAAER